MKIYLTRHGETIWNQKNWVQGMTDVPLSEKGMRQAEQLAEEMAGVHLDVVYTSQLQRAMVTGKAVADRHKGCRFEVCKSINEMNFDKYEGGARTDEEYQLEKRKYFKRYEGGESYLDVAARVYPFIEMLKARNEDALVVAHNGICRVFTNYFQPMENEEFATFSLGNCEVKTFNVNLDDVATGG